AMGGAGSVAIRSGGSGWGGARLGALQTVAIGNMLIQLAVTPVTLMGPTLAADFGVGVTTAGWVSSAYLLTLTGFMLLAGRLGYLTWHWVFVVNLPLGLIGALSALSLSDANARA